MANANYHPETQDCGDHPDLEEMELTLADARLLRWRLERQSGAFRKHLGRDVMTRIEDIIKDLDSEVKRLKNG